MISRYLIILVLVILAGSALTGLAEDPPWSADITKAPPGNAADLRPVRLKYTLDWNKRVNAGYFEIAVNYEEGNKERFYGEAEGHSTGFARLLFPYDATARSLVGTKGLRPFRFAMTEMDRGAENSYDIVFESKRHVCKTVSTPKEGEKTSREITFDYDFGHDVLSSAFYLRSHPLADGDKITLAVTPFNRPYLATFEVEARENHKVKGVTYAAIRINAVVARVNADDTVKYYDRIKKTTIWFSDDAYRIPLELQSQITFGSVSARLDEQAWLD
jgi:Protein of unknown function (DUF3108)